MKPPIEALLDKVKYEPTNCEPTGGLYATHTGVLKIGDIELRVHVLNDGQRVIEQNDLMRALGMI
jgi:hypothetical protein